MPYLGKQAEEGGALIRSHEFLQGTDTSTGTSAFTVASTGGDYVRVFLNGVLLQEGASNDYTKTTSAVTITGTAPADGDILKIDVYESITIWDTVSAASGGSFTGPLTIDGGINQKATTQNLGGTYSTERMYLNDSYTLNDNVTVTGHLALGTIADSDVVITQDSTERTITGSGTIEAGRVMNDVVATPSGHMIGVAQVLYKSAHSDNSYNQWKDYPGDIGNGTLSITPKATNSKFLVTWHLSVMRLENQYSVHLRLNRKIGSGSWDDTICNGETDNIRTPCTFAVRSPDNETTAFPPIFSGTFLDTPTLTDLSPVHYKFTFNNAPTTSHVYHTYFGTNASDFSDFGSGARIVQSLTVQEIAG